MSANIWKILKKNSLDKAFLGHLVYQNEIWYRYMDIGDLIPSAVEVPYLMNSLTYGMHFSKKVITTYNFVNIFFI